MDLRSWVVSNTYSDVEKLLYSAIRRFQKRYGDIGMSFEDLFQEACLVFMEEYSEYDRRKAAFSTYLCSKIHWRLFSMLKRKMRSKETILPNEILRMLPQKEVFQLKHFEQDLSDDARLVVAMAFRSRRDHPQVMRKHIKNTLKRRGWQPARIKEVFCEIREILE